LDNQRNFEEIDKEILKKSLHQSGFSGETRKKFLRNIRRMGKRWQEKIGSVGLQIW
jgi:hypothetical protein